MRVAIFGAGPAGLLAAHAAHQMGWEYAIYSNRQKSKLYGAQYLHQPIPGIPNLPSGTIEHKFKGSIEEYRRKVYGTEWEGVVSPEQFSGIQYAWDIRYAYNWLWDEYGQSIETADITGWSLMGAGPWKTMIELHGDADLVISTIPRTSLCVNPDHIFKSAQIYCIGDAPELGQVSPIPCDNNTFVCSGSPDDSWYRKSKVFGYSTAEWALVGRTKPPISGVVKVSKPTQTNCSCWPEISYQGRYGQWKKGVLTHDAYKGAILTLREYAKV